MIAPLTGTHTPEWSISGDSTHTSYRFFQSLTLPEQLWCIDYHLQNTEKAFLRPCIICFCSFAHFLASFPHLIFKVIHVYYRRDRKIIKKMKIESPVLAPLRRRWITLNTSVCIVPIKSSLDFAFLPALTGSYTHVYFDGILITSLICF